ncbi:hypothetical protein Daus18300_001029 [Diaporthe australafricana]|uniref:Uncharacterized protein n=1 Tax=Diaporthe australafricana TaxID=127596 RepID=A0ABR3XYS3_9PEZI
MYLAGPTDRILSVVTDPEVLWARLVGDSLVVDAPEFSSEYTLKIVLRAANAAGVPYEVVLTLKLEPVVRVPVTPENTFSIDLNRYLESPSDTVSIATEPNAPWVGYTPANQRVAGRVPADYTSPSTLITANVTAQKGGSYARYFNLVAAPVSVIPLTPGSTFTTPLGSFLLTSADTITSVKFNPNATWVNTNLVGKTFSGLVPLTLEVNSIIATFAATSSTQGLEYSFKLELYVQDSNQQDLGVLVPVVASNNFSISTKKYFPESVQLSAIATDPAVSWISFDAAQSKVSGLVPDLAAGTSVKVVVNASSAATPGSAAAVYSKIFRLEVQANEVPKFNVTLGAQFSINIGASLLSPPGDFLTSISTLPVTSWVSLGPSGKMVDGDVPINLAAGTSVAVTGSVFNPSLDSSYTKSFSLQIMAGSEIKVPVLIGGDYQINLTDFLRNDDDLLQITTSPPVDWVKISPSPPVAIIGTVPLSFTESEVNITLIATGRATGLRYTILAKIQVFTNQVKVDVFQSDVMFIDLVPLLKTRDDEVESIETFPRADWLVLDRGNRSVSGEVPLKRPAGSSVNITVNGLSTTEPDSKIGRLRGPAKMVARQLRRLFPYSVLVSVKIFDRPVVSTSALPTTPPPSSIPPQSSGPGMSISGPIQSPASASASDGLSSAPPVSQPSGEASSNPSQDSSAVLPQPSGSGGPTPPEPSGPPESSQVTPGPDASSIGSEPDQSTSPTDESSAPPETAGPTSDGGEPQSTSSDNGVPPEPTPQSSGDVAPPQPTPQSSARTSGPQPSAVRAIGSSAQRLHPKRADELACCRPSYDHTVYGHSTVFGRSAILDHSTVVGGPDRVVRRAQPRSLFKVKLCGCPTKLCGCCTKRPKQHKRRPVAHSSHVCCRQPNQHRWPARVKRSSGIIPKYKNNNPSAQPAGFDFSGVNFSRNNYPSGQYSGNELSSVSGDKFSSIQPSSYKFSGAKCSDYKLSSIKLSGSEHSGYEFSSTGYSSCKLSDIKPSSYKLSGIKLSGTEPYSYDLSSTKRPGNIFRIKHDNPVSRYISGFPKPVKQRYCPNDRGGYFSVFRRRNVSFQFWADE